MEQELIQQLITLVEKMDEKWIVRVIQYAEEVAELEHQYDATGDPILNGELSFEGDSDLSARTSGILRSEFGTN